MYCEGPCTLRAGKMRTFGSLRRRHAQFLESGGNLRNANKFANCINPCLLKEDDHKKVISVIPPSELHLMMGATNVRVNLIIKMYGLTFVENLFKG